MNNIGSRMTSASQLATDEIRLMIQHGSLEPNSKVSIDQLSEQLGVSRTPVREAVQRLELEGLVEIIPRVGVRVRDITPEEASDVYSIKEAIEPLASRWAAERSADDARNRLQPLLEMMEQALEADDVATYADVVERFHLALIELARAPAIQDMWGVISARVHWLRHMNLNQPGRLETSLGHHRKVAEAVYSGDGDWAYQEMADHMRSAHESALEVVASSAAENIGE